MSQKIFNEFLNYYDLSSLETTLYAPNRSEIVMPDAIDSFGVIVEACQESEGTSLPLVNEDGHTGECSIIKPHEGGTIHQGSFCRLRRLLPNVASNQLTSWLKYFCQNCPAVSTTWSAKKSVLSYGSILTRMNNKNQEYTVCFNMPDNGHYYIGLTFYA